MLYSSEKLQINLWHVKSKPAKYCFVKGGENRSTLTRKTSRSQEYNQQTQATFN